ncbi:MAG TPA: hypothetical protein VFP44_18200 [Usitatibacter sp.]|nr:hypothetical protein [Usitatibacter sp.]
MSARIVRRVVATVALVLPAAAMAAPQIVPSPLPPGYGDAVKIDVRNLAWPAFLPATRYTRSGNSIVIEMEYMSGGFASAPAFGQQPLSVGELPPGNYMVTAKLSDIAQPNATPLVVNGTFGVAPPDSWGIYTVPKQPQAFAPIDAIVRSAAYFDASSMRASVSGDTLRVDFDYDPNAPVGGTTPPGMTSFASVGFPGLPPGAYHLEGWGRPKGGGDAQRYFTQDVTIVSSAPVIEYYSGALDHYFVTAAADEAATLDSGAQPGWKRTGLGFKAWTRAADAPPGAQPVCRFYAAGPNSHFYTGDANECQFLRSLEAQQRSDAIAKGQTFLGWQYEGVVFYALVPQSGQCPGGTTPVYRMYNNRAAQNDSNHRFTPDALMRAAMQGWVDEGVAFCSPP